MKVSLHPVSLKGLKQYVFLGFRGDTALRKYSSSPGSHCHMADAAYKVLQEGAKEEADVSYYAVKAKGKPVGFTVLIHAPVPALYSFAINVAHRNQSVLTSWLQSINRTHGVDDWMVILNNYNERAIRFFQRNGFYIYQQNEKTATLWQ